MSTLLHFVNVKSKMAYLSVILPTCRPGGMDVTFAGLAQQTFKDFELIWCDAIRKYREPYIQDELRKYDFKYKIVDPIDNIFPFAGFARCSNTAFAHASGEIAMITADYLYMPPDCLEKHANYHKANPHAGYMGSHTYLEVPKLKNIPSCGPIDYPFLNTLERNKYSYD